MKLIFLSLLTTLLLSCCLGCQEATKQTQGVQTDSTQADSAAVLYQSSDFTDSLFSVGIEGPYFYKGYLYLVNLKKRGNVARVDEQGHAEVFIDLPPGSVGNGIRFNSKGQMLIADYKQHSILQLDLHTKELTTLAHNPAMSQPNDLAVSDDDMIFAADPQWSNNTGRLWRIDPDGQTHLLEKNMGSTNGIELSPDNTRLYVNESAQRNVWVYEVDNSGVLSHKKLFIHFDDFGMDGMRTDKAGNLYITRYGKGTIAVVSPKGKLVREIPLIGKNPTNLAFGGKDGKTVFVTMQDRRRVEYFRNDIAGNERNGFK